MVWQAIAGGAALGLANKFLNKPAKPDTTHLKQGIQWRVEDAKKAGISPLAALGANVGAPTVLNSEQSSGAAAISGAIKGGLKGVQAKREQELFLLQGNESRARTKLLEAQADAVTRAKLASDDAVSKNKSMSSADDEIQPNTLTPPPSNRGNLDARTERHGEWAGEFLNIAETPKRVYQGARNKEAKNHAKYVYDERTGRVYINPYRKPRKKSRSIQGRRNY